jgi:hypothetical protein
LDLLFQSTEVLSGVGLIAAVILSIVFFRYKTAAIDLNTFVGSLSIAFLPTFALLALVAGVVMISHGLKVM